MKEYTVEELRQIPALTLAYIGDAVYELMVRERLLVKGILRPARLHDAAVSYVNAGEQSRFIGEIERLLTDEERDIFRRGRNAKSGHVPANVPVTAYRRATGVECLIGWLYLNGDQERLNELFDQLFAMEE